MLKVLRSSLLVGLLLSLPAVVAWVSGQPFLFPSLGPSAFSLVLGPREEHSARHVIGGHLIGVLGGFLSYHALAHGLSIITLPVALSWEMARLVASGVISVVVTTAAMSLGKAQHPPACATTLIVSLGLLATFLDAVFIMLAVTLMYAVHRTLRMASSE